MRRHAAGVTLIEMLIVMAMLVLVLGIIFTFLRSQSQVAQITTARANVQDKVRYVMATAAQDLQLAGSSRYILTTKTATGQEKVDVSTLSSFSDCSTTNRCLTATDNSTKDQLAVRYISSLWAKDKACRTVKWKLSDAGLLQRSDVGCGGLDVMDEFADGILAFDIQYLCADGTVANTYCASTTGLRAARVSVYAQSDQFVESAATSSFTVNGTTIECPAKRACYGMQQEVDMPNMTMKD